MGADDQKLEPETFFTPIRKGDGTTEFLKTEVVGGSNLIYK